MRRLRSLVVGLGLFTAMLAGVPAASAASCGDVLTANTTLAADLTCSGTAFFIGAPGIVLDLDGHTLTGDGSGAGVFEGAGLGGFTVRNGTIENFEFGIHIANNVGGVAFRTVEDLRIRNNTDAGIRLEGTREVIVQRVRVFGNGTAANATGEGLDLIASLSLQVHDSVFFKNLQNGVRVNQSEEVVMIDNVMRDNGVAGIDYADAVDSLARGNRIVRNGVGVFLSNSSGHNVAENKIRDNADFGVLVAKPPTGESRLNNFTDNTIARNGEGMLFEDANTNDTQVVSNRVRRNVGNGILVTGGDMIIDDNSIARNGASGVALLGGTEDVANNVTILNGEWGIFVGGATVTGSGNLALFNLAGDCNQAGLCFP